MILTIPQQQSAYKSLYALFMKFGMVSEAIIPQKPFIFQCAKKLRNDSTTGLAKNDITVNTHDDGGNSRGNEGGQSAAISKDYVHNMEEMMFMTHHKVRQPVANILGIANLIEQYATSPDELKRMVDYMKQSALDLDAFTRELTTFVSDLERKGKKDEK